MFYCCRAKQSHAILARVNIRLVIFCVAALLAPTPSSCGDKEEDGTQLLVDGAVEDLKKERFDAALVKLYEAQKLDPSSASILNLLGAVYTKKKDLPRARTFFERSLEREADFFPAAFNIGELIFLEKDYPEALDYFLNMLKADPGNELLQFKVVLCFLLTDQPAEAEKLLARMRFPGNGPAWHYAQAASQIVSGNERRARQLIVSAQVIFPGKTSLYDQTFQDLGWPTH
ncbi:MAG: tetratricopeptide repeat protein [Terrimicrobiaceae bacterium]